MRPPASEYEGWCRRVVHNKTLHYYVRGVLLCGRYDDLLIRHYQTISTDYLLDFLWDRRADNSLRKGEKCCTQCLRALETRRHASDTENPPT